MDFLEKTPSPKELPFFDPGNTAGNFRMQIPSCPETSWKRSMQIREFLASVRLRAPKAWKIQEIWLQRSISRISLPSIWLRSRTPLPWNTRGFWCLVSGVDFLVDFFEDGPFSLEKRAGKNPPKNPPQIFTILYGTFWRKSTQGNFCRDLDPIFSRK